MNYESILIAGAANTVPHGLQWVSRCTNSKDCSNISASSRDDTYLVFALSNMLAVVLCSRTVGYGDGRIICTLTGHSGNVTAVTYSRMKNSAADCFASIGEDRLMNIWLHRDASFDLCCGWERVPVPAITTIGTGSLCALTSFAMTDENNKDLCVFAVSDSDSNIAILSLNLQAECSESSVQIVTTLQLPIAQLPYCLHINFLPSTRPDKIDHLILFVGSVDSKIHLFSLHLNDIASGVERSYLRPCGALSGHEDWVTCLDSVKISDAVSTTNMHLMIASGAQDSKIRLWRIKAIDFCTDSSSVNVAPVVDSGIDEDDMEADDDGTDPAVAAQSVTMSSEEDSDILEARLQFTVSQTDASGETMESSSYAVLLESLLIGHEDWVTSVNWIVTSSSSTISNAAITPTSNNIRLFSTSMDRNMVIWSVDEAAGGIWVPSVRVGDVGGTLGGSVGGNLLGFVGGHLSPCGAALLGIGYGGSFHLWYRKDVAEIVDERWHPIPFISGHFGSVNDVVWFENSNCDESNGNGAYVTTVSSDQTCRIFCHVMNTKSDHNDSGLKFACGWREVSRPEIHGYDLNCVVQHPCSGRVAGYLPHHRLFTAGEEKLIRVFDAPGVVLRGFSELCGMTEGGGLKNENDNFKNFSRIEQAYIPELGLSNKALEARTQQETQDQEARGVSNLDWNRPPLESQLADLTLWPEVKKMFGHGNEVLSMAMSADGRWIASACKARDANTARIILWDAVTMLAVQNLEGHESSVVSLEFSPDSSWLASGGKDRSLCIFHLVDDNSFILHGKVKAAHKRIIWDCSWCSNSSLVTASRDGICKIWSISETSSAEGGGEPVKLIVSFSPFDGIAVTAIETIITKVYSESAFILMVAGSERGQISIWKCPVYTTTENKLDIECLQNIPDIYAHGTFVKRIRCLINRDVPVTVERQGTYLFASVSADHTLRLHRISF